MSIRDDMPRQSSVTLLLLVAAAATVASLGLEEKLDREVVDPCVFNWRAIGMDAKWWFVLPAIASVIAIAALRLPRFRTAAIGLITGAAIAMWLLWARASALGTHWGPKGTLDVTLGTGLWARLVAAVAFSGAAAILISASGHLRTRVTARRDMSAMAGACLVLAGAMGYLVYMLRQDNNWLDPYAKTQAVIVLLVFLPVTLLRLNHEQRRAVLVAAAAFVIFVGATPAWLAVTDQISPACLPRTTEDVRIDYAVAVTGLLLILAGCVVSQGLRRSAWAGTHEFRNRPQT